MRPTPNLNAERVRVRHGQLATSRASGNTGTFRISQDTATIWVIVSDGLGWDHVSVSVIDRGKSRVPTWGEMCLVKDLFFEPDECVIQYHPPRAVYVNDSPYALHLWRPQNVELPMPDPIMVGFGRKYDGVLRKVEP
jgi:hypothetical protein